jgi:hypothetical protein
MRILKEIGIGLVKIALSVVILVELTAAVVFFEYTIFIVNTYDDKVAAAYEDGYDYGNTQTFDLGYKEAHARAYNRGYEKGYEIGLETGSNEEATALVELRNPTYEEMRKLLIQDKTDLNTFVKGEYVCSDFSAQLNNNAEANGIRAAYVRIRSKKWGHAIVAFETIDRGLVFIEPQSDSEVELIIGEPYPWQSVGAISPLTSYDPITAIQIIW